MFERFRSFAREGALELFGFDGELDALRETAADARLLARRVEDLTSGDLAGQGGTGGFVVERHQHREMVLKAYLVRGSRTLESASRGLKCTTRTVTRLLKEAGHADWDAFLASEPGANHKVRAIIHVPPRPSGRGA